MTLPAPSPKRLDELRADLDAFRMAYERYIAAYERGGPVPENIRDAVIARIPAAERAEAVSETTLAVTDPPALGAHRQTYYGLSNTSFLHERPGFSRMGFSFDPDGGGPTLYEAVLESVKTGVATLKDMAKQERRRRKNPVYWIDWLLRAVLGIPAYLLGLILGVPAQRIDSSPFGTLLRVIAAAANVVGIYVGGHELGWW